MNRGRGRPPKQTTCPSAVAHAWRDGVAEGVEMAMVAIGRYRERGRPDELRAWAKALKVWTTKGGSVPPPPGLEPMAGDAWDAARSTSHGGG